MDCYILLAKQSNAPFFFGLIAYYFNNYPLSKFNCYFMYTEDKLMEIMVGSREMNKEKRGIFAIKICIQVGICGPFTAKLHMWIYQHLPTWKCYKLGTTILIYVITFPIFINIYIYIFFWPPRPS